MTCPLCLNNSIEHYCKDKVRDYWQCSICDLVFVKPDQYLSKADEKAIYDKHENNPDDLGYRKFLNKLLKPLVNRIKIKSKGLDFGSGPGPTISVMLKEQGYRVANYDIFYANNSNLLNLQYDFITCTEVVEHLHHPNKEIVRLTKMLKKGGVLGIMTKRVIDKEKFKNWHYKNDQTHVCFYSDKTFEYVADYWGYELEIINPDTVILTKCQSSVRQSIRSEIASIKPLDEKEKITQVEVLDWIDSGQELCRISKPDNPPKHLVSYFALVDGDYILLVDHINAELWLPTGGHVEPNEHPRDAALRELNEELGVDGQFLQKQPYLITSTKTVGKTSGHIDVSLWYAFKGDRNKKLEYDCSEFNEVRWFHKDEIPMNRTDPEMSRFITKLYE